MNVGAVFYCQNSFGSPGPDFDVYQQELVMADMVEPLGFDSIWTIEHHFTGYTMIPDPMQFLSYLAGRTKRVGFGTMVIVLPWHDPVRVAEQIAMLDMYMGDRPLMIGIGRGVGRVEYDGFRIPMGEARERFVECAEILKAALSQDSFSYDGKYYHIPERDIRPRPRRRDLPSHFRIAVNSPETIDIAAKLGCGMLVIPQKTWADHAADYQKFEQLCTRYNARPDKPVVLVQVYCARTEKQAHERGDLWMRDFHKNLLTHYELDEPEHFRHVKGYEAYIEAAAAAKANPEQALKAFRLSEVCGTPEQCLEMLRTIARSFGAFGIAASFRYGGMPLDEAVSSMTLFARKVLPHLQSDGDYAMTNAAAG